MTFEELVARFIAHAGAKAWHLDRLKLLLPFFGGYPIGRITKNLARVVVVVSAQKRAQLCSTAQWSPAEPVALRSPHITSSHSWNKCDPGDQKGRASHDSL
jgi:hypothetical protein